MSDFIHIMQEYVVPFIMVPLLLFAAVFYAVICYKKVSKAHKEGSLAKRSLKQSVLFAIVMLGTLLLFLTPSFSFFSVELFDEFSISGTDVLFADRTAIKYLYYDTEAEGIIIFLMAYIAFYFVEAAYILQSGIVSYFTEQDEEKFYLRHKRGFACFIGEGLVYGILPLIFVAILNDELAGDYFGVGAAFVPLILQILVAFGYVLCKNFFPEDATLANSGRSEKEKKSSELQNIELLKQYKELLDLGVLTKEEFEAKKAELCGNDTEKQTVYAPLLTGGEEENGLTLQKIEERLQLLERGGRIACHLEELDTWQADIDASLKENNASGCKLKMLYRIEDAESSLNFIFVFETKEDAQRASDGVLRCAEHDFYEEWESMQMNGLLIFGEKKLWNLVLREELVLDKKADAPRLKGTVEKKGTTSLERTNIVTLKGYKELLDLGVLTKEEFEAKKAELFEI